MQRASGKPSNCFPVDQASLPHLGIKRAVEFLREHHSRGVDLEQVASQACLSKYHLSRLFHRTVGMSYQDYLTRIRTEQAKRLLAQTPYLSLTCIAHRVGFGSLRNLEGLFKKLTRQSPSQYRARSEKKSARSFARTARSRA
jgi:transcriptional regulator GlxA family with amidase domain